MHHSVTRPSGTRIPIGEGGAKGACYPLALPGRGEDPGASDLVLRPSKLLKHARETVVTGGAIVVTGGTPQPRPPGRASAPGGTCIMAKPAASIVVNGHTYVLAPVASAPVAGGTVASPVAAVPTVDVCACGHAFRFGRTADAIAANPLGLCGLKGRTTHRNS
jgi:hypothetical protein